MENKVEVRIVDGFEQGFGLMNTVTVYIENKHACWYSVRQSVVESIFGEDVANGSVFHVSKEKANELILHGRTLGEKRFIK